MAIPKPLNLLGTEIDFFTLEQWSKRSTAESRPHITSLAHARPFR